MIGPLDKYRKAAFKAALERFQARIERDGETIDDDRPEFLKRLDQMMQEADAAHR